MSIVRSNITARIAAMASANNLVVAYENVTFNKPPHVQPFLELLIIPSETIIASNDGSHQREVGMVQINIWCPQNKGTKQTEDIFDAIRAAFSILPQTRTGVNITSIPTMRQALTDMSGYRVTPVTFNYRFETTTL